MAKTEEQTEEVKTEETAKVKTEETAEAKTEQQETVPKARFEEVMAEKNAAEERVTLLTQQQQIIQANQQKPAPKEEFDIYKHVGLDPNDPDDVPTQAQLKEIQKYNMSLIGGQMAEIQFMSTHPDYSEIVGTDEGVRVGQFAPPLTKAIKENPALLNLILSSPNKREAAYQIAKLHVAKDVKVDVTDAKDAIDEAVKNAQQVKSSSNATGGGVLSEAGRYSEENMPEDVFIELARKRGATV